jgi:hypothetical protein
MTKARSRKMPPIFRPLSEGKRTGDYGATTPPVGHVVRGDYER